MSGPVRLLYVYASEDEALRRALAAHLSAPEQEGLLQSWHAGLVTAGSVVDRELAAHLARADVVLLLLSAAFMASDRCQAQLELVLKVAVAEGLLVGASCGDSGAWVVRPGGGVDDLTVRQRRKPRLGSGGAVPVPFSRPGLAGTLLVATDGLFKYAGREKIAAIAFGEDLDGAARALVQLVRLPGGQLQDDVGVVLVRGSSTR